MKFATSRVIISFILLYIVCQPLSAHAGLSLKKFSRALRDVATFGEAGRERDRKRAEATAREAQLRAEFATSLQEEKIAGLTELANFQKKALGDFIEIHLMSSAIAYELERMIFEAENQLTYRNKFTDYLETAGTTSDELNRDLNLITSLLITPISTDQHGAYFESWLSSARTAAEISAERNEALTDVLNSALRHADTRSIQQFVVQTTLVRSLFMAFHCHLRNLVESYSQNHDITADRLREGYTVEIGYADSVKKQIKSEFYNKNPDAQPLYGLHEANYLRLISSLERNFNSHSEGRAPKIDPNSQHYAALVNPDAGVPSLPRSGDSITVWVGTRRITVTPDVQFFNGVGFTRASDIKVGSKITMYGRGEIQVTKVNRRYRIGKFYSLRLSSRKTYKVLETGAVTRVSQNPILAGNLQQYTFVAEDFILGDAYVTEVKEADRGDQLCDSFKLE